MDNAAYQIRTYMEQLHVKAVDPDVYILHRLHYDELLAGACITGKLFGVPNASEYYFEICSFLAEEPRLDGKDLRALSPDAALQKVAEQFCEAAQDAERSFSVRHSYTVMLDGLTTAALFAEIEKMGLFRKKAEALRAQISREEGQYPPARKGE